MSVLGDELSASSLLEKSGPIAAGYIYGYPLVRMAETEAAFVGRKQPCGTNGSQHLPARSRH